MPAGLVNQLLACYWVEIGVELENEESKSSIDRAKIIETINKIRKRKRTKFEF